MNEQVFVGREKELADLKGYLDKAMSGHGRVCFATGQAGSGKTALVRRFTEQALAENPDLVVITGGCNAQTGIGDPYLPFREALGALTGDATAQQSASKVAPEAAERLQPALVRSVQVLVEVAPDLIGVFVPGATLLGAVGRAVAKKTGWMDQLDELAKRRVAPGEPGADQSRVFEQYTAFLQQVSSKVPLLLFLDDLQWADNPSIALLFHLGRHLEGSRILIVGAYRPNDVALGRGGQRHPLEAVVNEFARYYGDVSVDLDAIPEPVSRQFVDAVLDAEPNALGEDFREALFHHTGGHALFTVELVRAMEERGHLLRDSDGRWRAGPSLDWNTLPARVEGVIEERIGRLSDELKEVLTIASVEGEQFTAEVVARVKAVQERDAIQELSNELQRQHRLVNAIGPRQLGAVRLSLYRFSHNLFQQYLYGGLDAVARVYLHRDMGAVMEALFAGETEEVAAQLARHFEEGSVPAKAAAYHLQAGNRAQRMSAHQEAAEHLTRGLELLSRVPPGPERTQLELGLQLSLAGVLSVTKAFASQEVERAYARARELCRELGDPPQTIPVLHGLCVFYLTRGEIAKARAEAERLLPLAQQAKMVGYEVGFHFLLGATKLYEADFEGSRQHLEQAVALYDPVRDRDLAYQQGVDPLVISVLFLSWALWLQGYPEQAMLRAEEGLRWASEFGHPHTSTMAAFFGSTFHQLMRQWPQCQALAEGALEVAGERNFGFWQIGCAILRLSALAHQGDVGDSIAEMQRHLADWKAAGQGAAQPYFLAYLAEVCLLAGKAQEGLEALDWAFAYPEERWWLAEQHRLRGELLLLAPGNDAQAEASLRTALEVAGAQQARFLELRAAMSLARLLQRQGRADEARELLAKRCAWFTEGLDAPDLLDAQALLHQLVPQGPGRTTTAASEAGAKHPPAQAPVGTRTTKLA